MYPVCIRRLVAWRTERDTIPTQVFIDIAIAIIVLAITESLCHRCRLEIVIALPLPSYALGPHLFRVRRAFTELFTCGLRKWERVPIDHTVAVVVEIIAVGLVRPPPSSSELPLFRLLQSNLSRYIASRCGRMTHDFAPDMHLYRTYPLLRGRWDPRFRRFEVRSR